MDEMIEKLEYVIEKYPEEVIEFAKKMYKHNPEAVERMLEKAKSKGYITSRKQYDELIDRLKWANNNGKGAKWTLEELKKDARNNFDESDYTEYDFAYLVNMLYAKCCKEYTDRSLFLKLAKCLLEDNDEETKLYRGAYSKRKYHDDDIKAHYDDWEDRKRMRKDDDEYYHHERRYYDDDRRNYDRSEKRYYKETNMGF